MSNPPPPSSPSPSSTSSIEALLKEVDLSKDLWEASTFHSMTLCINESRYFPATTSLLLASSEKQKNDIDEIVHHHSIIGLPRLPPSSPWGPTNSSSPTQPTVDDDYLFQLFFDEIENGSSSSSSNSTSLLDLPTLSSPSSITDHIDPSIFNNNALVASSSSLSLPLEQQQQHQPYGILHPQKLPNTRSNPSSPLAAATTQQHSTMIILHIMPAKPIGFANCRVRFNINIRTIPWNMPYKLVNLSAVAITPSGSHIPCNLNINRMNSFNGYFQAREETGQYVLQATLTFSSSLFVKNPYFRSVVRETCLITISKSYYVDSLRAPLRVIQAEFTPYVAAHPFRGKGRRARNKNFKGGEDRKKNEEEEENEEEEDGEDDYNITTSSSSDAASFSSGSNSKAWGLACDKRTNRLYYSDRTGNSFTCLDSLVGGQTIFKFLSSMSSASSSSSLTRMATAAGDRLRKPTGLCVDETHNRLIVADKDNHRIAIFSLDGKFISSFGGNGFLDGKFRYPWDVDVSPNGDRILVSDSKNKRIQMFDGGSGRFLGKFSVFERHPYEYKEHFYEPRGVCFDTSGRSIFVTDFMGSRIVQLPLDMSTYRKLTLPYMELNRPQGIVVDDLDNLLVCDSRNNLVRHVSPTCDRLLCSIEGVGSEKFKNPFNLVVMGGGKVAVLDECAKIRIF